MTDQQNKYTDSIIQHITDCGLGMIGGQPQPYGVLIHELEQKVVVDVATFGERKDEVERHRAATLERLREAMERQNAKSAEADDTTGTDIVAAVEHNPSLVLVDDKARDRLIAHIEAEIAKFEPDLSTAKGRDEIKRFAFSITRTKTAADKARLQMTEDARQKIQQLNAAGKTVTEKLDALAKQVRQPLTEWEEAEEKRQADCMATLERLRSAAVVPMGITADSIRTRIGEVEAESMSEERWAGMLELGQKAQETALAALRAALERVQVEEEERAELQRLRAEREEREKAEEARRQRNEYIDSIIQHITDCGLGMIGGQPQPYGILVRELEEKLPLEIEGFGDRKDEVERHRIATLEKLREGMERQRQKDEAARKAEIEESRQREAERAAQIEKDRAAAAEKAAQEAEASARREEQEKAEAAAAEARRQHEAALAEERRRAEEAEARERERKAAEEAERQRREEAEANETHRTMVKREAKQAIMSVPGVTEEMARAIVLLLIAGEIPRATLDFAAEPRVKKIPAEPVPDGAMI